AAHEARERAEAALAQAQKLEAIGQLASGVAHDFNNLLSVIGTSAELALRDAEAGKVPLLDDLQQIKLASQRAALLTRQLLAFSRRQVLEVEVVDVRRLALDLEKLLRRLLPENISLRLSLENDAVPVMADPGQLEQVIVNLVVNARDAVGVRGKIELRVARVEVAADDARCASGMAPGAYASLAVSDDGCGMSEELQSRIFEPFFTTKAPGKGTGLGLSTVYGIVEQSGGGLEVRSAPGLGAS
ncbi:MAG: ATP-binding protein, partial [Planctomycetes bacterium]|nr:ATP-binding protein [Planctomycetota bacterium]